MDTSNIINICILGASVIAMGISIWSALRSSQKAEEANRIQEKLLKVETERDRREQLAGLKARFEAIGWLDDESDEIVIEVKNRGNGTARNVHYSFDGEHIANIGWVSASPPLGFIWEAGTIFEFKFYVQQDGWNPSRLYFRWTDDLGKPDADTIIVSNR